MLFSFGGWRYGFALIWRIDPAGRCLSTVSSTIRINQRKLTLATASFHDSHLLAEQLGMTRLLLAAVATDIRRVMNQPNAMRTSETLQELASTSAACADFCRIVERTLAAY